MMKYDDWIKKELEGHTNIIWGAAPIAGWLWVSILFGLLLPMQYIIYRKNIKRDKALK